LNREREEKKTQAWARGKKKRGGPTGRSKEGWHVSDDQSYGKRKKKEASKKGRGFMEPTLKKQDKALRRSPMNLTEKKKSDAHAPKRGGGKKGV